MDSDQINAQMMAFLDDELSTEERVRFMEVCYADPELAAELARYRRLNEIADAMRLREPEDHEYERIYARVTAQIERRVGFGLLAVGVVSLVSCGLVYLLLSALPLPVKLSAFATIAGLLLLAWHVIRIRLRLRRFDRYTGVTR